MCRVQVEDELPLWPFLGAGCGSVSSLASTSKNVRNGVLQEARPLPGGGEELAAAHAQLLRRPVGQLVNCSSTCFCFAVCGMGRNFRSRRPASDGEPEAALVFGVALAHPRIRFSNFHHGSSCALSCAFGRLCERKRFTQRRKGAKKSVAQFWRPARAGRGRDFVEPPFNSSSASQRRARRRARGSSVWSVSSGLASRSSRSARLPCSTVPSL